MLTTVQAAREWTDSPFFKCLVQCSILQQGRHWADSVSRISILRILGPTGLNGLDKAPSCIQESILISARHKSPVRTNLQSQFFPECLAFLHALEKFFEDADHNRIHADAFRFGPFL